MLSAHDKWLLPNDPRPSQITGGCDHCKDEIYVEEMYFRTKEGECIHEDCWEDFTMKKLGAERRYV
ncbi:hypothetical protein [Effusibacillus consociatus]|uniref:Uncharacterized protein n=1 Tax=Effusibacillus consociatus TaxID=1117041 RepID=A0ABV9Q7U8_9BACL